MSTFLAVQVPTGIGEIIKVETLPLAVEASPEFEEAKQLLRADDRERRDSGQFDQHKRRLRARR